MSAKVSPDDFTKLDSEVITTKRETQLSVQAAEALLHHGESYLPHSTIGDKQNQMDYDGEGADETSPIQVPKLASFEKNSIMISYCRRNSDFVHKLHHRMHETGRDCWVDWEDIPKGEDWWEAIKRGIERAHACVVCLSEDFLKSAVCKDEVDYMISCSKRIVPIVVVPDLNWDLVRPDLAKLNFVFFNRPQDDFEVSFKDLITALDTDYGYLELHTWFTTWALEWAKHNRDPGALLKGPYLEVADEFMAKAEVIQDPQPSDLVFEFLSMSQVKAGQDEMKELLLNQMLEVKREGLMQDELEGMRQAVQRVLANNKFQLFIMGLIMVDVLCGIIGLTLTLQTTESTAAALTREILRPISLIVLVVFLLEICAQAIVSGWKDFVKHHGFVLDFVVITLSLVLEVTIPENGGTPMLTILRAWRVTRIFNISKMKMKHRVTQLERELRMVHTENNGLKNVIQSLREQLISKDALVNNQRKILKQIDPSLHDFFDKDKLEHMA